MTLEQATIKKPVIEHFFYWNGRNAIAFIGDVARVLREGEIVRDEESRKIVIRTRAVADSHLQMLQTAAEGLLREGRRHRQAVGILILRPLR